MDALGLSAGVDDADVQSSIAVQIAEFKVGGCPWTREVDGWLKHSGAIIAMYLNDPRETADDDFRSSITVQIAAGHGMRIVTACLDLPEFE